MKIFDSMKQLVGYCGLDCELCDARTATLNNDDELRARTARLWCEMNNTDQIKPEHINCKEERWIMKLLINNASPRKNGNISKRLELMGDEARRLGAEVSVEFAQAWKIRPCMGCMKCRRH